MKKSGYIIAIALVVAAVAVKYFQPQQAGQQVLELPPETDVQQATVAPREPAIRYPVPELPAQVEPPVTDASGLRQEEPAEKVVKPAPEPVLPMLDDSDKAVTKDLDTLGARPPLEALFNLNRIIRRFVVTVDNLPRKQLLQNNYRSNKAIHGQLVVDRDSNGFYLSKKNYARYNAYVDLLETLNSNQLITLYLHYYPLIQAAYTDLGYPSAYFNDRLIAVIDHLLETPVVGGRVSLVRPHVLYRYADPKLEALSAGQKVLIRIGPRNAARVRAKLRELRQGLSAGARTTLTDAP